MKCPYCDFEGHRADLHAHLTDTHPDGIKIYVDAGSQKLVFEMSCPICHQSVKQPLKKKASILEEYKREIRMVAYDILLYHFMDNHPEL
ncbi:MAG: hypothetical protein D6814_04525 [Calditrichaeota bacterium]|nr:MAG: hypothetical protein D6814_04525 [Calditrichota bacterium]